MRIIFVLFILFFLSACTLYESDGREAIKDNKADIVVIQGFDTVQNISFQCLRSLSEPKQTKGPAQVIDHEFEADGYSAYIVGDETNKSLLVYQVPHLEDSEPHRYCGLDTHHDFSKSKLRSAIRLGVQLLVEQKELD